MIRSLFVLLAGATTALAQPQPTREDANTERPHQFGGPPQIYTLADRPRIYNGPVDVGLVNPPLPEEALTDVEAWLREPIPGDELAIRRVGFRRPARGTVFREPITLPDEDSLRLDEIRLRPTIDRMQGLWRVRKLTIDGIDQRPEDYAGLKYLIQGTVLAQSMTGEEWGRAAPVTPKPIVRVGRNGLSENVESRYVVTDDGERAGPTAFARPAGGQFRNDPKEEEGIRLQLSYEAEGRALVYWWDRYGEVRDPHMGQDRPSIRVSLPVRGALAVSDGMVVLGVRGLGLRHVLPSKFHRSLELRQSRIEEGLTPLESERTVLIVMVRDEALATPPISEEQRQQDRRYLGRGEPGGRGRINIIPEMHRVPLDTPLPPPAPDTPQAVPPKP